MNGVSSPTRRARSGSITNRNATPTVPAVASATSSALVPPRSRARSSPASPRIGCPPAKSSPSSIASKAPATVDSAYTTGAPITR
jgi:hypothetical protein